MLWWVLRMLLLFVMYMLRPPVRFMCALAFVPVLIAFLVVWHHSPEKTDMVWGLGTTTFLTFLIPCTYDMRLLAIAPE